MTTVAEEHGPIKGVIKHRGSGDYYKGEGEWTRDVDEAMQFDDLADLVSETHKYGIHDCCEFVMQLEGSPGLKVLLPL